MRTRPIEEVFDEMGIEWKYGAEEEVKQTIKLIEEAFAEIGLYPKLLNDYETTYNQNFYINNNDSDFVKPNNQSLTNYSVVCDKVNVSYDSMTNDEILLTENIVA